MDDHLASEKVEKIETNVSGDAPNEGRNETGSCTSWRGRLFFIEVYMTLALLLYMNSVQIVQQYIFQTLAREALSNTPNYTAPNESVCLDQDLIVSATGSNDSIIQIQQKTNSLAMYLEIVRLGLSAVMALIFGSLSDIVGRKPVQAICLFGLALCCGVQVAVIELQLNMYILIAAAGINGCFGGLASILGVSFAAVSDVTSKKWRTLRMGTTESAIGFGKMSSYLMVYYWINYNGCDFKYPAYSLLGIASLAFIYLMCLPESLPPKEKRKDGGFKRIASGAYVFVNPRFPNWVKVWVCVALISIQGFCAVGMGQIINYYLHNKPLEWTYDFIGIYGLVTSVSHIVTLIVVLPLLMALPIPEPILNPFIIVFAALVAIGTNAMMATVKTDWEMFVGKCQFRVLMSTYSDQHQKWILENF